MKRIEIDPAIQAMPTLLALVRKATELLEAEIGRSTESVSAIWSLIQDQRGRPLVRLAISDWTGSVEAVFAPEDLSNSQSTEGRIIRLWGDLLQVRSHQLLDELRAAAPSSGGA